MSARRPLATAEGAVPLLTVSELTVSPSTSRIVAFTWISLTPPGKRHLNSILTFGFGAANAFELWVSGAEPLQVTATTETGLFSVAYPCSR